MNHTTPMCRAVASLALVTLLSSCSASEDHPPSAVQALGTTVKIVQPGPEDPGPYVAPEPENSVSDPAAQITPPQIPRFMSWLDLIEKELVGNPEDLVDPLVDHKVRAVAFNIQALGRLYKGDDPIFDTLHKQFRSLEDAIGEYQKWKDLVHDGEAAHVSEAVMAKLIANRENGRKALVKTLISTRFTPPVGVSPSYIEELRQQLIAYKWKDVLTDRQEMLQKLIEELEDIKTTKYDFTRVEEGNGVHEFRRKMRWFSMEARALQGMVTLKPATSPCPVPSYANIVNQPIANTKYAVLPGSAPEPQPIMLTPCLYVMVAQLIEEVNWIKAKVELKDSLSEVPGTDRTDPEDQKKLETMFADIMRNDLFGRLQRELVID